MPTLPSAPVFVATCAAIAGGGVAFLLARAYYTARLREAHLRAERVLKALAQANEYLRQARQQADSFRKELMLVHRPNARKPPAPVPDATRIPTLEEHEAPPLPSSGFPDTLPFAQ